MPRPTKHRTQLRSRQIAFRLTESEYARVVKKAERAGLRPNEFARKLVWAKQKAVVIRSDNRTDPALLKRIDRIAANINQLTKNAHIFKRVSPQLEPLCREIRDIVMKAVERRLEE